MAGNRAQIKIVYIIGVLIVLSALIAFARLNESAQASNQLLAFCEVIPLILLTSLALITHLLFHNKHT